MALGGMKLAIKYLDPDLCYAAWVICGSASRASLRLKSDGITHPVTCGAPSKMGITYAAKASRYYQDFMARRVEHPESSGTADKLEFDTAKKLYAQRLIAVKERVKEMHEQYGTEG